MNQKFVSFDIETAKVLPDDVKDVKVHRPLGIACAAVAFGNNSTRFYPHLEAAKPRLSKEDCKYMVYDLLAFTENGYTIVSWNGAAFDFDILAEESGLWDECAQLATHHVDLMYAVVCSKGHYLGLDKALTGMRIEGKKKIVTLNDGSTLDHMGGGLAPELWSKGEYRAVLEYLGEDVRSTLELAEACQKAGSLLWTSGKGRQQTVFFGEALPTVKKCSRYPLPNTGWMTDPPDRYEMIRWFNHG